MFGWEFPPFQAGGLATARVGLVKGLLRNAVDVTLVVPFPAEQMKKVPVGDRVGDPKNEGPELIEEVPPKAEPPKKVEAQLGFDW